MAIVSLVLALMLEQWRPLVDRRRIYAPFSSYASWLESKLNAGEHHHGIIAWVLAVVPATLLSWGIYALLFHHIHWLVALAFNVAVLYVTMGFRQESHYFTDIHKALKDNELDRARAALSAWRG